jgi:hypothetical protein
MLEFARIRALAAAHGVDSISRQPGLLVIGHHDLRALQRLRGAWERAGKTLRIVGEKTAVIPLDRRVGDDPDRLLELARTLLRAPRDRSYSPRPSSPATRG